MRSTLNEWVWPGICAGYVRVCRPARAWSGTRRVVHTYWSGPHADNERWATFLKGDVTDVQKQRRKADVQEAPDSEEGREGRPEASRAVSPAPLNPPLF